MTDKTSETPEKASVTDLRERRGGQRGNRTPAQKAVMAKGQAAQKARGKIRQAARESGEDGPTRWELYLKGDLSVQEWDDQELARCQTRNFHGQFQGRAPALKPQQIREIKAELLRRGERDFSKYGQLAIKTVARIMVDEGERAADRLRAANIFLERCYGKVPDTVRVSVAEAWSEDIDAVFSVMDDADSETA